MDDFYKLNQKEVLSGLSTNENGLDQDEAKNRISKYGLNEIKEKKGISPVKIFLLQFNNPVVYRDIWFYPGIQSRKCHRGFKKISFIKSYSNKEQ